MLLKDAAVLGEDETRTCEAGVVNPEFYRAVVDGVVEETGNIAVVQGQSHLF